MANLKEVRNRISSVDSTKQITSAMKMVAAAKLRKAQEAITTMRPYAEKLQEILQSLSASLDTSENVYAQQREVKKVLLVPITSNRGLCGAFNNNVIKRTQKLVDEVPDSNEIQILPIGKKVKDEYRKSQMLVGSNQGYHDNLEELFNDLTFEQVAPVAERIMEAFKQERIDRVRLIYNRFKNPAQQVVTVEDLLPIDPSAEEEDESSAASTDHIFEPSKEEIVEDLIPRSLKTQFYKALLDSHAGEHGARMTAMHQATDNATDLLHELRLTYNKVRQATITNEILEIVSGADALEEGD